MRRTEKAETQFKTEIYCLLLICLSMLARYWFCHPLSFMEDRRKQVMQESVGMGSLERHLFFLKSPFYLLEDRNHLIHIYMLKGYIY